jgi:hypothetical protein
VILSPLCSHPLALICVAWEFGGAHGLWNDLECGLWPEAYHDSQGSPKCQVDQEGQAWEVLVDLPQQVVLDGWLSPIQLWVSNHRRGP